RSPTLFLIARSTTGLDSLSGCAGYFAERKRLSPDKWGNRKLESIWTILRLPDGRHYTIYRTDMHRITEQSDVESGSRLAFNANDYATSICWFFIRTVARRNGPVDGPPEC